MGRRHETLRTCTRDERDLAEEKAYPLPTSTLPGMPRETLVQQLRRVEDLFAKHNVATSNTRIERYRRYLERPMSEDGELDKGVFIDPPSNPIQHRLDRELYVAREVHELTWIGEGLRDVSIKGLPDKLRLVVGGADFAASDSRAKTESRNTQFELRIASYLSRAGYRLDLSSLTDVVATRGRVTYYVECKRVASASQLTRRLKQALDQLDKRQPKSSLLRRRYGVVAADVTKVAFPDNGFIWGVTPDHTRDVIREKLNGISRDILDGGSMLTGRAAIALWLQIHIPALVLHPPATPTRFSSLILINPSVGSTGHFAAGGLMGVLRKAAKSDPDVEPPQPLQRDTTITIPAGTTFKFDEELIRELVVNGVLPERPYDHLVLTVHPPGSTETEAEYYSYFELRNAFQNLSDEDRETCTKSFEGARQLIAPLVLQRYPYGQRPPWLMKGSESHQHGSGTP